MHRWIVEKFRQLIARPSGLAQLGAGSRIDRPFSISGRKFVHIGSNTRIRAHSVMSTLAQQEMNGTIRIGDGVYVGMHFMAASLDIVEIGNGAVLSDFVFLCDTGHGIQLDAGPIMSRPLLQPESICIGPRCFVGRNVFIAPGVQLGEDCVVGAYSVVTRSFPPRTMIAGNPARVIKQWNPSTARWDKSDE